MRQCTVVRTAGAAAAVLDYQVGVVGSDLVDERREREVVAHEPLRRCAAVVVTADAGRLIVVVLDITDAHRIELVYPLVQVASDLFVREIEERARNHAAVALQEAVVVEVVCRGVRVHRVKLEPNAGLESAAVHIIEYALKALVAELRVVRYPVAAAGRPAAVRALTDILMPAGVDTEILAADRRRRVNKRQQLLIGRVAPQAVHVVVEYDRNMTVGIMRQIDRAVVSDKLARGFLEAALDAAEHRGLRGVAFARLQEIGPAAVFLVCGRALERILRSFHAAHDRMCEPPVVRALD